MNRNIYVVFSHTNTVIGRLIRFFTKYEFNHVSISSHSSLQTLYSFARFYHNSPLVGGFIEESPLRYIYKNKNVPLRIYCIELSETKFQIYSTCLDTYLKESSNYIYNTLGIICQKTSSTPYQHTCLSFVVSILKDLNILSLNTNIHTIKDLADILSPFPYVDTEFNTAFKTFYTWGNDKYSETVSLKKNLTLIFHHFHKLLS